MGFVTLGTYSISILHYSLFYDDGRGLVFRRPVRVHKRLECAYYMHEEDASALIAGMREQLKNPKFIFAFSEKHEHDFAQLWECIENFRCDLPNDSKSLAELWSRYWALLQKSQPLGDCFISLDEAYFEKVENWAKRRLTDLGRSEELSETMIVLSSPWENFETLNQEIAFARLAVMFKNRPIPATPAELPDDLRAIFDTHWENWCWIPHWYDNEPFTKEFLLDELRKVTGTDVERKYDEISHTTEDVRRKALRLIEELDPSEEMEEVIAGLRQFTFFRTRLDLHTSKALYYARPLYERIARTLSLTFRELKNLTPKEITKGLAGELAEEQLKQRVQDRWDLALEMFDGDVQTILIGRDAEQWIGRLAGTHQDHTATMLKGMAASPGTAEGSARVLTSVEQVPQVQEGEVLVVPATSIDFVVAMKKSVAIVTEVGGITSHAAIVSRELGIPCVVNTKTATKAFTTGQRLRVDGSKGTVHVVE